MAEVPTTTHLHDPLKSASEAIEPWRQLESVLTIEYLSTSEWISSEEWYEPFGLTERNTIARALWRERKAHVMLTGDGGVGKTTLMRILGRAIHRGDYPHLMRRSLVRFDVSNVGPEDSRACLEAIFSGLSVPGHWIICLDGLAKLLQRGNGGNNKPFFRTLLQRPGSRIIGIISDTEYAEHIGCDATFLPLTTRVRLNEPQEAEAFKCVRAAAKGMERRFEVKISDSTVERAIDLSQLYLMNERHPSKALQILWHASENIVYDHKARGEHASACLQESDLVQAVSDLTDLPFECLHCEVLRGDFTAALQEAVVGQDEAIAEVAAELNLIAAGLTEANKPASVLLFAGMTGVGKTELAKRIAELYSASRRLNVYSMGNYTEPHSVSGLIGVPPGYVGHDQGGRLINDLNADPYGVFLLDEAEKCHPNIWKPFLHLFDEGWITDLRGAKAYADRAIFILTTNVADQQVSRLFFNGESSGTVSDHVVKALAKVRQERSSQVVFPPQFVARIKRVIAFRPLSKDAMQGIAERIARRVTRLWLSKQGKQLCITPEVILKLGEEAYERNVRANGQDGGRVVRKLFADRIERAIQAEAIANSTRFRETAIVNIALGNPSGCTFGVNVTFYPS